MSKKSAIAIACFCIAILCLILEAGFLLLSSLGPFFPSPILEASLRINALLLIVAAFYFFKYPSATLVLGWTFLLISSYMWWRVADERSAVWFLYQQSLPMVFILFSHLAAFLGKKRRRLA